MSSPMATPCHEVAAVIGADVGGTYARLGWMPASGGDNAAVDVRDFHVYHCAEHAGLGAILCDYADRLRRDPTIPPVTRSTQPLTRFFLPLLWRLASCL